MARKPIDQYAVPVGHTGDALRPLLADIDYNFIEIYSAGSPALLRANNLSDLVNAATARTNLFGSNFSWDNVAQRLGLGASNYLVAEAANTLALQNGANAQRANIYAGYVDASNYSRAYIDAGKNASGVLEIGSEHLGAGATSLTKFRLFVDGVKIMDYNDSISGAFVFSQNITQGIILNASARVSTPTITPYTGSNILLANAAGSDAPVLQLGGTTAAFPALKRSGTTVQARIADDSAFGSFQGKLVLETEAAPASATATGVAGEIRRDASYIYVCTATNTWARAALSTW